MKLYAIIDKEAKCVVNVFQSTNDATAKRSFLSLITGNTSLFTDWPEQFALYPLCEVGFEAGCVKVSAHGLENVNAAGFKIDTFKVSESIVDGSDYDKRYLRMIRSDRGFGDISEKSIVESENVENE